MSSSPPAGRARENRRPADPPTDGELLRVVAVAVLLNVDRLRGEGLGEDGVDEAIAHARALTVLTARSTGTGGGPDRRCRHALGLGELLSALRGPTAATLVHWLDDALGTTS